MKKPSSPEVRDRSLRKVLEPENDLDSQRAPIASTAEKIGGAVETLTNWLRQAERHQGLVACLVALCLWPTANAAVAGQGVYVDVMTVDKATRGVARISTRNASEYLVVTNYVTRTEVYRKKVRATEQTDGPAPWIDAEWPRSERLPLLPPGLYLVEVDSAAVTPNRIPFNTDTYRTALFVVPTDPTATLLLVLPSLTSQCYNEYGGKSCYTYPAQPDIGYKRPGISMSLVDRMVKVIERANALGITWDVVEEQYIESNPEFLYKYRAVVVVDQMEYGTFETRGAFDAYLEDGNRLLLLGATETWIYMVRKSGDTYSTYRSAERLVDPFAVDGDPSNDHLVAYASAGNPPNYPEAAATGVSTWLGYHPSDDHWTAYRTDHWFYEGTGLADGDSFRDPASGHPIEETMIIDGVTTLYSDGLPWVFGHAAHSIPLSTMILATVPTSDARPPSCGPLFESDLSCRGPGTGVMAIHEKPSGGIVLAMPDKQFVSYTPGDPVITQIVNNVLVKFASEEPLDAYDGYSPYLQVPALGNWGSAALVLAMFFGVQVLRRRRSGA